MKKRRKKHPYYYYNESVECHLCGLPIPGWVVNHDHPLFGTIDHLQPKSQGGKNEAVNRAPAHKCCNNFRGTRVLDNELRRECFLRCLDHVAKLQGVPNSKRWRNVVRLVKKYKKKKATPPQHPDL